ncbi:MAG: hypothetical protein U1E26_06210 [Coriobacteriia bacterium]|nr:hypothetical protein [Coriobacteriia bacterium]
MIHIAVYARQRRHLGRILLTFAVCLALSLGAPVSAVADDNTVPADPPLAVSPQSGVGNQWSRPYQWFRIPLNKGDSVSATLTVTSAGDSIYLRLYPPGTTDGRQSHVAEEANDRKGFDYTATRSGDYLFRVFTFSYGDSAYTFTFEVDPAPVKTALGLLSTPVAPSRMSRSLTYNVTGHLKPRHTAGSYPVRIYRWRKISATAWKPYGYINARAYDYSSYTKYVARIRLSTKGTWKLRAYAPEDTDHLAKWSGTRYVTVR